MEKLYSSKALLKMAGGGNASPNPLDPPLPPPPLPPLIRPWLFLIVI